MTEWIEWHGGAQPVRGFVEYRLRDGFIFALDADFLDWDHISTGDCRESTDIVAYHLVEIPLIYSLDEVRESMRRADRAAT